MLEWLTERAVTFSRYATLDGAEWDIYERLEEGRITDIGSLIVEIFTTNGYRATYLIPATLALLAAILAVTVLAVNYCCRSAKSGKVQREDEQTDLISYANTSDYSVRFTLFNCANLFHVLLTLIHFVIYGLLVVSLLYAINIHSSLREDNGLPAEWHSTRADVLSEVLHVSDSLPRRLVPDMMRMRYDIRHKIDSLPSDLLNPFADIINIYKNITVFVDTLPVMIKGLNRISIAVDHLTLLDTVLNNTLLKVTGDLHQQLSRLTEQQCPGDCALLLDEALKLTLSDSMKLAVIYPSDEMPDLRRGVRLAEDAKRAILQKISTFSLVEELDRVRRRIAAEVKENTLRPLATMDDQVFSARRLILEASGKLRYHAEATSEDIDRIEDQITDVLKKATIAALILPTALLVLLVVALTARCCSNSRGGVAGGGAYVVLMASVYLVVALACVAFTFGFSLTAVADGTLCQHDHRDNNTTTTTSKSAATTSTFTATTSTSTATTSNLTADATWSILLRRAVDRYVGGITTEVSGVDVWTAFDACSRDLSLYRMLEYTTQHHDLFNVTGMTSMQSLADLDLHSMINITDAMNDMEMIDAHTWIKSRIAGEFMSSFDEQFYLEKLNKTMITAPPIEQFLNFMHNFTDTINSPDIKKSVLPKLHLLYTTWQRTIQHRNTSRFYLLRGLDEVRGPISYPIEHVVDAFMRAQINLKKHGQRLVVAVMRSSIDYMISRVRVVAAYLTDDLGRCKAVPPMYDAHVSETCHRLIQPYVAYMCVLQVAMLFMFLLTVVTALAAAIVPAKNVS